MRVCMCVGVSVCGCACDYSLIKVASAFNLHWCTQLHSILRICNLKSPLLIM